MPVTRSRSGRTTEGSITPGTTTSTDTSTWTGTTGASAITGTSDSTATSTATNTSTVTSAPASTGPTATTSTAPRAQVATNKELLLDLPASPSPAAAAPSPAHAPAPRSHAQAYAADDLVPHRRSTTETNKEQRTLRASSKATSRRSRLALLEMHEKLAQLELQEVQAAAHLQRTKIQRMRAELSSSDEEIEEDGEMTVQRVDMWFERQLPLAPHPAPLERGEPPRAPLLSSAMHTAYQCREERPRSPPRTSTKPIDMEEPLLEEERGQGAHAHTTHGQQATWKSPPARSSNNIDIAALASAITEAVRTTPHQAPKYVVELPPYTGRTDEWLSFKATFTQTQDSFTAAENIARLRRSLKGPALDAVSALLITQANPYVIIQALERRFGRPEALVLAEMEKIKTLPRVTDSPRDLCIFASKISNIVAAVELLKKPQYLHSPEMLRLAIEKLSPIMKNKWYDYTSYRQDDKPELKKLTEFLNYEADKCAAYALLEPEHDRHLKKRTERTYVTTGSGHKSKREGECPVCKKEHQLPECPQFLSADVNTRWEMTKKARICFRCLRSTHRRVTCRARPCGQNGCTLRHHKLLHLLKRPDNVDPSRQESPPSSPDTSARQEVMTACVEQACAAQNPDVLRKAFLKVAQVTLTGPNGSRDTFALLDEGSTVTIISTELADTLGLDGPTEPMAVQGVNGDESSHDYSKRVSAKIKGKYEDEVYELRDARTFKNMKFFKQTIRRQDIKGCKHIEDIADELVYENATPEVLIGQDNWELIISRSVRGGSPNQPVASRTQLGWVLHGCRSSHTQPVVFCGHINDADRAHDRFEEMMKKHFALESLGIEARKQGSDPERQALDILEKKSRRLPDGRYETGLLWRDENAKIPNNYEDTKKRLRSLEKKLDRDEHLKTKYEERIHNLLKSNYAERATEPPTGGRTWYLPHFAVVNPEKKKIRLVHDAAARSHGRSLNDMLLPGPDLLQSLPGVIMKFRQYPIAVSSDIKEMFMQIKIAKEDRDALRFLWRGDRRDDRPPDEYRMTSVIFGASSSPCTALYIKNRNAQDYEQENPTAAKAIRENHYMDDYLHSFENIEEAIETTRAVDSIHRRAGFELRGWTSNDENAIQHFTGAAGEGGTASAGSNTVEIGGNEIEKTLGLLWYVKEDTLGFRLNKKRVPEEVLRGLREPTKREALSLIMSIFDPLGIISPVTTPAKRIMQDTWKYRTDWDEPIPDALTPRWRAWLENLENLHQLQVPRCYDLEPAAEREIHTFVDASEEAYAAVVYLRTKHADGSIKVTIAAAKSRVTPTKLVSIPRLELQAAVVGARLANTVQEGHDFEIARKTYWSDSRTALSWIRSEPRTYKAFVAHRLAEIEDLTKKEEWRWVPTSMNVADDSTRNTPNDFSPTHRWFTGPEFLYQNEENWPQETKHEVRVTGEEREGSTQGGEAERCLHTTNPVPLIDFTRFSKWHRLVRTMGRVLQFIDLCRRPHLIAAARRKRTKKNPDQDETYRRYKRKNLEKKNPTLLRLVRSTVINLDAKYLYRAERTLIKIAQEQSYGEEHGENRTRLTTSATTANNLAGLSVVTDNEGIKRLRGRVNEADAIDYETANPIVLDGGHRYTRLYIQHVHEKLHHGGVEMVVNELRQRLWIVRIRPTVKSIVKRCPVCRLRKAKPGRPSTGDLPAARLAHHARPFTFTGLDYFGPIEVTVSRHREKRYVALFTCMTSRALHLEMVTSLSTDSAINALRRFIARRGCPTELWSDNATCFRSANKELAEAWRALEHEASNRHITWRFLPPAAPFMAGVWERMVRTVKEALRVTLHEQHPSDETLVTLLAEAEATVNSRPLTHVAVTPDTPPAITPNMILLGPNCHVPNPGMFEDSDLDARAHWKRAQRLADIFWGRWVREYLPLLQNRREPQASGTSPKVGDVVIICDSNLPRNTWPRGRVTTIYPGKDGEVRVVDVTTSSGRVLRRPTKKIVVLPVESQDATAGECSRRICK